MLPPLRERREEIPVLTDYFLKKYSVHYNKAFCELAQDTMKLFMEDDWPGNVRELENLVKRAVVLGTEGTIRNDTPHAISISPHRTHLTPPAPTPPPPLP